MKDGGAAGWSRPAHRRVRQPRAAPHGHGTHRLGGSIGRGHWAGRESWACQCGGGGLLPAAAAWQAAWGTGSVAVAAREWCHDERKWAACARARTGRNGCARPPASAHRRRLQPRGHWAVACHARLGHDGPSRRATAPPDHARLRAPSLICAARAADGCCQWLSWQPLQCGAHPCACTPGPWLPRGFWAAGERCSSQRNKRAGCYRPDHDGAATSARATLPPLR